MKNDENYRALTNLKTKFRALRAELLEEVAVQTELFSLGSPDFLPTHRPVQKSDGWQPVCCTCSSRVLDGLVQSLP